MRGCTHLKVGSSHRIGTSPEEVCRVDIQLVQHLFARFWVVNTDDEMLQSILEGGIVAIVTALMQALHPSAPHKCP